MRKLFSALALLLTFVFLPLTANADGAQIPYNVVDCSISSLTGSSQSLVAKNPQRKYLMIFNSGANIAYVNLAGGTAATSGISSLSVAVGGTVLVNGAYIDTTAVTVIGTASQPVTCYEGR